MGTSLIQVTKKLRLMQAHSEGNEFLYGVFLFRSISQPQTRSAPPLHPKAVWLFSSFVTKFLSSSSQPPYPAAYSHPQILPWSQEEEGEAKEEGEAEECEMRSES